MRKKSMLLIGAGRFGRYIAQKLNEMGHQIMAVDINEERINAIMPYVTEAQIGNSTDEIFLKSLGVPNYDVCIVTIGNDFQSSLETTSLLKELGAKIVVSRAERDGQAKFLLKNGADDIVYPESQLATWLAVKYSSEDILDYLRVDDNCSILEVSVPDEWCNKSIIETNVRKKYNVNIIAIKENGKVNPIITPDIVLNKDMSLFVIGEFKTLKKLFAT